MAKRSMTAPATFATGLAADVDRTIKEVFEVIDDNIDDIYARAAFKDAANTFTLTTMPEAANNAAAQAAGVAVGGFYRTAADPSHICIRTA